MKNNFESFSSKRFSEDIMRDYLPSPVFRKWKNSVEREESMDQESADAIAHAMKTWALECGATHYSHWFHPMTGSSAQKHVAFLEPSSSGEPISRFSGKNLIKGETDGSSFPNGGLRQTFEARGYTYWDVSSPAFVRGHVLFIPSIFISYHGESLDVKAPLIKAMDALSLEATRVVNALGEKSVRSVKPMVGLEQEYFLISKSDYEKRDDLRFTGRTLFGNGAPRKQESFGHYFGSIPSTVVHYMKEVNEELWKLGIYSKVEHNEVAPSQFENAVVFQDANIAIDQNMLVMETLKRVALKHDMVALVHEKPFNHVNGSGKHNNFSIVTDTGSNLFDPGEKPHENIRFLVFASALLSAVDRHAELLRYAASTPGNDFRLGADEAPPAIISIYLGGVLTNLLEQIEASKKPSADSDTQLFSPLASLLASPKDYSDRNRTSPFAFTGNKFEFRMPGSSICSAFVNTVLCSALAQSLEEIAKELEPFKYVQEARDHALVVCKEIISKHKRIVFNGDGYHKSWIEEATKRGLPHSPHFVDTIASLTIDSTISLFESQAVLSKRELDARYDIALTQFSETVVTEAKTTLHMARTQFIPAAIKGLPDTSFAYGKTLHDKLSTLISDIDSKTRELEGALDDIHTIDSLEDMSHFAQDVLRPSMERIRELCDTLELTLPKDIYPVPSYSDMLFQ